MQDLQSRIVSKWEQIKRPTPLKEEEEEEAKYFK
jgi:hypothetical protein